MFGLGHLPEILLLLFLALLVFGPKKMIEMGSSFGRMFRDLREATREMSWSNMLSTHESPPSSATPGANAQPAQPAAADLSRNGASASSPVIVESTIEHPAESKAE